MKALIMCGGRGKRLGMGEKSMLILGGKRLIEHVINALDVCDKIFAVTTKNTPETEEFLKKEGIKIVRTSGIGYVEDMREALKRLSIAEPILIISGDLFIRRKKLISDIIDYYFANSSSTIRALQTAYRDGIAVGINILDGMFLDEEQKEIIYKVSRNDVININTPEDLKRAEMMLDEKKD
jgi:adenosylcobinamide-phosphate guanylyltransferase